MQHPEHDDVPLMAEPTRPAEAQEAEAQRRYRQALADGLSDHEAREAGWPRADDAQDPDPVEAVFPATAVPAPLLDHVIGSAGVVPDPLEALRLLAGPLERLLITYPSEHDMLSVSRHRVQATAEGIGAAVKRWESDRELLGMAQATIGIVVEKNDAAGADLVRLREREGMLASENARMRTSVAQHSEVMDRQRDEINRLEADLTAWRARAQEAEAKLASTPDLPRAERPAHTEVIRPAAQELPERRRGPFTLADECVERIASRTVLLMAEASANPDEQAERIAERVADRLVRRAGPILGSLAGGAVRFASDGAKVAAQGLEAFRAPTP